MLCAKCNREAEGNAEFAAHKETFAFGNTWMSDQWVIKILLFRY
jgi:hypothetical protein